MEKILQQQCDEWLQQLEISDILKVELRWRLYDNHQISLEFYRTNNAQSHFLFTCDVSYSDTSIECDMKLIHKANKIMKEYIVKTKKITWTLQQIGE